MKDYSKAYKAYDIRAIYDDPIDNTFVYSLGKGVGKHLLKTVGEEATFVFGADVREANNELVYWFLKWLEEGGCMNYVGVGIPVEAIDDEQQQLRWVASTAMLYYFAKGSFDMGAVFTASHNPAEYVGLKIVNNESLLVPSDQLEDMVDTYESVPDEINEKDFKRIWNKAMGEGNELHDIIETKIQVLSKLYAERFSQVEKKYKIVVDFSNGAAIAYERMFLDEIVAPLGHELIYANDAADSAFCVHLSDTTDVNDYVRLQNKVKEEAADFGVMFDGDGDRLWFVDNKGNLVWGDVINGMIASSMLRGWGDKKAIIHDVFFTKAVIEKIKELWWIPMKCRVWYRYIKEMFKEHGALFWGELSGHLFFNAIGWFECPLLALYRVMDELSGHESMFVAAQPYLKYYKPPLRMYEIESNKEKENILERIKKHYSKYELDFTDGVGVSADDFWFVIRWSNTTPVLKMVMEADTKEIWDKRIVELEALIVW